MAKPEWGTKRSCPKCGTRFYDLQKDDPVVCIDCGNEWVPEPILKSKQPVELQVEVKNKTKESDTESDDIDLEEDDIELDSDDDVTVEDDDDDDDVSDVVVAPVEDDDS